MTRCHVWCCALAILLLPGTGLQAAKPDRPSRSVGVVLGTSRPSSAVELAQENGGTLFVPVPKARDFAPLARAAEAAGLLGKRVFLAHAPRGVIPLADNVADFVADPERTTSRKEIVRVLRPGGWARLGDEKLLKPWPKGTDRWSHHYHGPDNNPQSRDKLARAPFATQFVAAPRYGPAPQMALAAGGRLFMAFGHVAWHKREEPWLNTLVAVNGYNGTMLWKRPLREGIMVDRSTMIATADAFYLADAKSCKVLDPDTGKVQKEITVPKDLVGGTFWKWMALSDGVLYALVGADEPADKTAKWRRRQHGWPWGGISKGYNKPNYTWGFAHTLVALDALTGKVLWHHREKQPIDSRALCLSDGRIYLHHFGRYLTSLDAKTGKPLWRKTAEDNPALFRAIGPYRPGHGYIGGWKSTVYLKATAEQLFFVGPQVNHLTAVSARDGRLLWTYGGKDLHVVIRPDGVYCIGPQQRGPGGKADTHRIDPDTGKILASYGVWRRACTRSTGTADGIFFRAPGGSVRLDLATGKTQWVSPMRPSCHVGVIVADGHLYWVPWTCDCNLQMFGVVALGHAPAPATNADPTRLHRTDAAVSQTSATPAKGDWPTYRADNARTARWHGPLPSRAKRLWEYKLPGQAEPTAPVTAAGLVLLAGRDGAVRALDAASGKPRWTTYTSGAVRYPPALAGPRALVGSADGWAYALDTATGKLLWRFLAAPRERRICVYGQVQSTWPVAAGVLVDGDTAYLAAGMNNFDGTHVYALDVATGKPTWANHKSGHLDAFSRRGVAVQGDLLLHQGRLYLAGGNAASPGVFDIRNGRCLTPPPRGMGSRAPRGRELTLTPKGVTVTGQPLYSDPASPVYDRSVQWQPMVVQADNGQVILAPIKDGTWALIARAADGKQELWRHPLPSPPVRWGLAADAKGRLFVTLRDGRVLAFGE